MLLDLKNPANDYQIQFDHNSQKYPFRELNPNYFFSYFYLTTN